MRKNSPATCDHAMSFSHRRSILESLSRIGDVARVIITVGLLASIGVASTSTIPQKLTVHRSMRAVPRRFVIHPNGATLPVNKAQRFDVTDSEGRPVAVRWNVSGLGCSGASCGTIDDQGIYRTPSSLPRPRVVILEGVLVSDPRYSVLTEIRLETTTATNVNAGSVQFSTGGPQTLVDPVVQRQNMPRRTESLLRSQAVEAAPVVHDLNSARRVEVPMPQQAVAATPLVERPDISRHSELKSFPQQIVAAPPALGAWEVARIVEPPRPPHVVAAPPSIQDLDRGPRLENPPPQQAVGIAPAVERWDVARNAHVPPPPHVVASAPVVIGLNRTPAVEFAAATQQVIAAPPAVKPWSAARTLELPPPHIVASAPAAQELSHSSRVEVPMPEQIIAAPPTVQSWNDARIVELPLPHAVAAAPAAQDLGHRSRPETSFPEQAVDVAPAVETRDIARNVDLTLLPNVVAAAPVVQESNRAPAVEYALPHQIIAAPPTVEPLDIARGAVSPPLPQAVAAAPLARDLGQSPHAEYALPRGVVAAPPALEPRDVARVVKSPPLSGVVAASPVVRELPPSTRIEIPMPQAVAPAPVAEKSEVARKVEQPPLTIMRTSSTPSGVAGSHTPGGAILSPLPVEGSAAQGETGAVVEHAPVVIYRNGRLTINAENATLADVLKLVAEKTGATIDVPPGSGQERIVEHSGPGRANDILTQLLNGSHFNFIIVNSPQHPDDPTQVLLSLQRPETDGPSTASVSPPQPQASPYWKPPEPGPSVLPPQYDSSLTPPPQGLSPEALGELMKAKGKEILEKAQQEAPPQ